MERCTKCSLYVKYSGKYQCIPNFFDKLPEVKCECGGLLERMQFYDAIITADSQRKIYKNKSGQLFEFKVELGEKPKLIKYAKD